jgi:hypothetical protein
LAVVFDERVAADGDDGEGGLCGHKVCCFSLFLK